jgi:hypothetical protein
MIIRAGAENTFGLLIGSLSNLIAIDEAKIAPSSQGRGKDRYINITDPIAPIKRASNIEGKLFRIYIFFPFN